MWHEENNGRGDSRETAGGTYVECPTNYHREHDREGINKEVVTEREGRANPDNATDCRPEKLIARGRLSCPKFGLHHRNSRNRTPEALVQPKCMGWKVGDECSRGRKDSLMSAGNHAAKQRAGSPQRGEAEI